MDDFFDNNINDDLKKKPKNVVKKRKSTTTVKLTNEEKLQAKYKKIKVNEAIRKEKRKKRQQKKVENKEKQKKLYDALTSDSAENVAIREKYAKEVKTKKIKEKKNFSLYLREWPIKMLKEIYKIKWASKKDIAFKFLWVIIFIVLFGSLFYFVDWGISTLFMLLKIV